MSKELAKILHDLDGLTNYIEALSVLTDDPHLSDNFRYMQKKTNDSKAYIIESVVKDVCGSYVKHERDIPTRQDISLFEATALIKKIEERAASMDMKIVTAVYNSSARPIAVHCMDDAYIASFDVAVNKAYTSAALKMPTSTLKPLCQPGEPLYGIQHTNEGKIVIFGGGEVLIHKDRLIGAIGVSGGTEEADTALAEYGRSMLEEVMTW